MLQRDLPFPWIVCGRKVLGKELTDPLIETAQVPLTQRDTDEGGDDAFRDRLHIDAVLDPRLVVVALKDKSATGKNQQAQQRREVVCHILINPS